MMILIRQHLSLFLFLASVSSLDASIIRIDAMNSDVQADLEGNLSGSGVNGSSLLTITATPSTSATASTFADYTVSNVDLNEDAIFDESFSFRITFSSPSGNGINFSSSLELMGIDGESSDNEEFNLGESFTMAFSMLSDTSLTHGVSFEGMDEIDFVSMSGTDLDLTSLSGNKTVTLAGGGTSLGGMFVDPTFTFINTGANSPGTLEDWSVQFSSFAEVSTVPEPSSAFLFALMLSTSSIFLFKQKRKTRVSRVRKA